MTPYTETELGTILGFLEQIGAAIRDTRPTSAARSHREVL